MRIIHGKMRYPSVFKKLKITQNGSVTPLPSVRKTVDLRLFIVKKILLNNLITTPVTILNVYKLSNFNTNVLNRFNSAKFTQTDFIKETINLLFICC